MRTAAPGTPPRGRPELVRDLEDALSSYHRRPCRISGLRRRPYVYSTSFSLEELDVQLQGGGALRLLYKDLSRSGMSPGARIAKPAFLYNPLREIDTYRSILAEESLGTARCYGAVTRDDAPGLFLERVPGRELYQVGDLAAWVDVARWLAGMHDRFVFRVEYLAQRHPHLLRYDAGFYRRWLDRAGTRVGTGLAPVVDPPALRRVKAGLEHAIERLTGMPMTFVHGEMYASNVLVSQDSTGRRVCPVDWEMAGVGPGLLDLAALCSGWDEATGRSIALAYRAAQEPDRGWPPADADFLALLDCSSLCLAVQWLGWSPHWSAPPEHARDWLGHALELVDRLQP